MLPKEVGLQLPLSDGCCRSRNAKGSTCMRLACSRAIWARSSTRQIVPARASGIAVPFHPRMMHAVAEGHRIKPMLAGRIFSGSSARSHCRGSPCHDARAFGYFCYVATSIYYAHIQGRPRKNSAIFALVISPEDHFCRNTYYP